MSDADTEDPAGTRLEPNDGGRTMVTASEIPLLVADGIGGRLEVTEEQVRLLKGGVFGHAVELLWLGYSVGEKSMPVRTITSVELVEPLFLPNFIRFSYPGSPPLTGSYFRDALAENALIMGWFDNRPFYRIKAWLERWPHRSPAPVPVNPGDRAPR